MQILNFIRWLMLIIFARMVLVIGGAIALLAIMFALLSGCTPFVSELSDSSGCLYSTGGPIPGMASGVVVVCRSGRDKAAIDYSDAEGRKISIRHHEP
jgi:hypothetical protein